MAAARARGTLMKRISLPAIVLFLVGLFGVGAPAMADEVADIHRLMKAGQTSEAMAKLDESLAARPKDPQLRFLKGVLLAEANRDAEAIAVFTALNADYPELAEPYNNLAVIYAGQGEYDKARDALEAAVRGKPEYAMAYENLGDVYARLAARAYARALALDASNASLAPKIARLQTIFATKPIEARPSPP
jgi:tetratricopeptide (TPR) repeat protein